MIPIVHKASASPSQRQEEPHGQTIASQVRTPPDRFFFADASPCDDADKLARWWDHAGLDRLGELVPVLLAQSIELSSARLEMERAVAASDPGDPAEAGGGIEAAMHSAIGAMADFQRTTAALIARFSSTYVSLLILRERLLNTDHSIALHQSIANNLSSARNDATERDRISLSASSPIAELHALRETLQGEKNTTVVALSECLCETPDITLTRLQSHALPAGMAPTPGIGTPSELYSRRADLISLHHLLRLKEIRAGCDDIEVRLARLAYEQGRLLARSAVDRAISRLCALKSALTPARACAANADARARLAQQEMRKGNCSADAVSYAHVIRFNKNDREIEIRGETYLALIQLFEALGGGWESGAFMSGEIAADAAA